MFMEVHIVAVRLPAETLHTSQPSPYLYFACIIDVTVSALIPTHIVGTQVQNVHKVPEDFIFNYRKWLDILHYHIHQGLIQPLFSGHCNKENHVNI